MHAGWRLRCARAGHVRVDRRPGRRFQLRGIDSHMRRLQAMQSGGDVRVGADGGGAAVARLGSRRWLLWQC